MADIFDYQDALPHKVSVVICLKCYHRWLSLRPSICKLIDLECPNCGLQKYVIETGEVLKEDYTMIDGV